MSERKEPLVSGSYYHIYNRGAGRQDVFNEPIDSLRFLWSLTALNTTGSIHFFRDIKVKNPTTQELRGLASQSGEVLVTVMAYCLLPNHFHLILRQECENGISKYMQKLGTSHTRYMQSRYEYSGSLFQGKFKSRLVENNEDLVNLSAYVNGNFIVHGYSSDNKIIRSSMEEFLDDEIDTKDRICSNSFVDSLFRKEEYYRYVQETTKNTRKQRGIYIE